MRGRQAQLVFLLVVGAIILAIFSFIAISWIGSRPDPTAVVPLGEDIFGPSANQVFVDGVWVTLQTDPNRAVRMPETAAPIVVMPEVVAEEPTPIIIVVEPVTPTPELFQPVVVQAPPAQTDAIMFINYVVQPGDTLYGIASQRNSSIELMALHGIASDSLVTGHTLRLPVANPAFCPGRRPYIVRDKDTVFRIAQQFNTTANALRDINGLGPEYRINVTQVICVP
jgi:LysM repeat protein